MRAWRGYDGPQFGQGSYRDQPVCLSGGVFHNALLHGL